MILNVILNLKKKNAVIIFDLYLLFCGKGKKLEVIGSGGSGLER